MSGTRIFVAMALLTAGLAGCGGGDDETSSTPPVLTEPTTRIETTNSAEPTEESTLAEGVPTYAPLEGAWMDIPAEGRTPPSALELVCEIALEDVPEVLAGERTGSGRRWDNAIALARSLEDPTFTRFLDEQPSLVVFEDGDYVSNTDGIREWGLALQHWCTWNLEDMGVEFTPILE